MSARRHFRPHLDLRNGNGNPKTQVQKPACAKATAGKPNLGHPQRENQSTGLPGKKRRDAKGAKDPPLQEAEKRCWHPA